MLILIFCFVVTSLWRKLEACRRLRSPKHHSSNTFCPPFHLWEVKSRMLSPHLWNIGYWTSGMSVPKSVYWPWRLWTAGTGGGEAGGRGILSWNKARWGAQLRPSPMRRLNVGSFHLRDTITWLTDSAQTDDVLDNEHLKVDFTPLYQCIHIYGALDALEEIRKSYQADRKVGSYSSTLIRIDIH